MNWLQLIVDILTALVPVLSGYASNSNADTSQ
jgi:hypothetical protein